MKIGHLENKAVTPAVGERKPGAAAAPASTAEGGVEASAKVALSPTVSQLAAGSTKGVFDAEKVQRISDAIRDGKFTVNPGAIADKLIANAQELLGAVGKR
ncbi:MAG TPA: flagellar biosynthesis anti-sigma factor FlgM [Burkholderiaceae bacterium]|nr:flagellar biosynthesis anti-sigma factor FlgM [Burkholderiaceae bacterium]